MKWCKKSAFTDRKFKLSRHVLGLENNKESNTIIRRFYGTLELKID